MGYIKLVFSLITSVLDYLNTKKLMAAGALKERTKNKEALDAIKEEQANNDIDNIDDAINVLFPESEASNSSNSLSKGDKAPKGNEEGLSK